MKLILCFTAFLFIMLQATAQGPVLTSANSALKIGDAFLDQSADKTGVSSGTSGANQVWNYSNLTDSGAATSYTVLAPAATPYADSFPGTNVAVFSIQQDSVYQYFQSSPAFLKSLGAVTGGYSLYYQQPKIFLTYPFSYGSFFSDTVVQTIPTRIEVFRGRDSVYGDGYGTLMLPGKTYTDVLRLKYIENITTIQSLIPGFSDTINIRSVDYLYMTPGIDVPLLSVSEAVITNSLAGTLVTTDVYYAKNFTTLPLTFLSFSASLNNRQVLLQWQTAQEVNTGSFHIQRSLTGTDFTTIGQVAATGNAAGSHYTFTDIGFEKTGAPTAYYRLQEMDKDGKYVYSDINVVHIPAISGHVYPNPAKNFLNLNVKDATVADQVRIYDVQGVLLQQYHHYAVNKLLDISNLSAGNYFIHVTIKGITTISPVLKQ